MTCLISLKDVTRNAPFCLSAKYSQAHSRATLSHAAGLQTACQPVPRNADRARTFYQIGRTAVGLGAGVFDEVRHQHRESVYLTSTRHPVDGTLLCEFKEEHSHATDHLIYLPDDEEKRRRVTNARTLVLIDDAGTTGNTFINLLSALQIPASFNILNRLSPLRLPTGVATPCRSAHPCPSLRFRL